MVELLLRAADDPSRPYFVILDEMNLARVECYFSDFLSALESDEPIELMSPGVEEELLALGHDDIPAQLQVPPNVSFVGTVNVDETTQSFSPKVLDRANVIEFSEVDIERALGHPVDDAAEGLRLPDGRLNPAWLCSTKSQALAANKVAHTVESFTEALEDVHDLLARFHLHFGSRVINEVSAFVGHALQKVDGAPEFVAKRAFDLQVQQKVLPKLTGGRELEQPLTRLLHYCLTATKPTAIDPAAVRDDAREAIEPGDRGHRGAAAVSGQRAQAAADAGPARGHGIRRRAGMSTPVPTAVCGPYEIVAQHDGSLHEHPDRTLELVAESRYLVRLGEGADPNAYRDALGADSVWTLYPGSEAAPSEYPVPWGQGGMPAHVGFQGVGAIALRPGAEHDGGLRNRIAGIVGAPVASA